MDFRKTLKNFDLKIFGPSHSRYVPPVSRAPASELVLQRGGLASEIAFQGGKPRVQNRISKGSCGLRKPKKYFQLIMIRVA